VRRIRHQCPFLTASYGELQPAIGIHLLDFDLFQDPAHQDQALWCFEMRDAARPTVTLGQELQLNLIELRKADRLQQTGGALGAWITLFEHWQEEDTIAQIVDPPVRAALDKLKTLSADAEARRLAFVRGHCATSAACSRMRGKKVAKKVWRKVGRKVWRKVWKKVGRRVGPKPCA
jgi:hypothetical protein